MVESDILEVQQAFFIRQFLRAIERFHCNGTVHLDIRPENIAISESDRDCIRLKDHGLSRDVRSGPQVVTKIAAPEFVAPEVILRHPVTLATDMWISGVSPFLGDSDIETLQNVAGCRWSCEPLTDSSADAVDFISKLLVINPKKRLSVYEALAHAWIQIPERHTVHLNTDFLKEFKYRHQWLERRVYVKSAKDEENVSIGYKPKGIDFYLPDPAHSFAVATLPLKMSSSETMAAKNPADSADSPIYSDKHRNIEDELANRVLSDISEESSVVSDGDVIIDAETTPTGDEMAETGTGTAIDLSKPPKLIIPPLTVEIPDVPSGFQKRFERPASLSPGGVSCSSASSNVIYSPASPRDVEMIAIIHSGRSSRASPRGAGAKTPDSLGSDLKSPAGDADFEKLMSDVDRAKKDFQRRMKELKSLNQRLEQIADAEPLPAPPTTNGVDPDLGARSRQPQEPKKYDFDGPLHELQSEMMDWSTNYQMGPETYLLSLRDPSLSARIREYRRELFGGDEADYVAKGVMNILDKDISIRERRRYTDLVKTDKDLQAVEAVYSDLLKYDKIEALRKMRRADAPTTVVQPSQGSSEGYAPVFRSRLTEAVFGENGTVSLQCSVLGDPTPEVFWFRNEAPLVETHRVSWAYDGVTASLTINPAYSTEAGLIKCLAKNANGESWCAARLRLGDLPAKPGRPDVVLASDTEVFVVWEPPAFSGGTDIACYRVEYRRISEGDWSCPWVILNSSVAEEALVVRHLDIQGIYQFRVFARNAFGWGDPSLASRMIQTHQKGAPKLNLELLRKEYHFNVVNVHTGLDEIPEDNSEEATSSRCSPARTGKVDLNTSDPRAEYQLDSEVFRGRFCVIRNAIDQKRENAAHCIAKILLAAPDYRTAALEEYECLREVQHDHVVTLLGSYLREDFLLLFMERLDETLLARFTHYDYYTEEQCAKVATQLLSALQWIHFKRFVHLDVQPDNVMFIGKRSWNVKLIDFGSALKLNTEGDTKLERLTDTLEYAAPELVQHGSVVPSSDVWSVGLILYILMSGFHPFYVEDDPDDKIIRNIIQTKLDINYVYSNASQEALHFVTWALKKHPANRMTTEEGLQHRWLRLHDAMLRRRENIKFSSNRLRVFARQYAAKQTSRRTTNNQLLSLYGAET